MARGSITARFWDKTWKRANSLCWPWLGYVDKQGYARLWVNKELGSVPAQRVSLILFNQDIEVKAGDKVLTCPVLKSCVNPLHVGVARGQDIGDRILLKKGLDRSKGYVPKERVLTDNEIVDIFKSDKQTNTLATELGITPLRITMIRAGKHYKKITKDLTNDAD